MPLTLPSNAVRVVSNTATYMVGRSDELILVTPHANGTTVYLYDGVLHDATGKTVYLRNMSTTQKFNLEAVNGLVDDRAVYYIEPTQMLGVKCDGNNWWVSSNDDLTHQIQDTAVGGVLSVDWRLGKNHVTLLTTNVAVSFTGGIAGGHYVLVCWQDGFGDHGITWPGDVAYSGNIAPIPALDAGAVDLFAFYYDGDTYIMAGSLYATV